jgi:hypothetical protein
VNDGGTSQRLASYAHPIAHAWHLSRRRIPETELADQLGGGLGSAVMDQKCPTGDGRDARQAMPRLQEASGVPLEPVIES